MLKVVPGDSILSIKKQILALKWAIRDDNRNKDKIIHIEALKDLKIKLEELQK